METLYSLLLPQSMTLLSFIKSFLELHVKPLQTNPYFSQVEVAEDTLRLCCHKGQQNQFILAG